MTTNNDNPMLKYTYVLSRKRKHLQFQKKIQQWQKAQKNTNTLKFVLNIHQFMFYG